MQYLIINRKDTLADISKIVRSNNIDSLLTENGLIREPAIGKQWYTKCDKLIESNPPEVTGSRKAALLNGLTGSSEVFEKACLMDEDEWKIFSAFGSFRDSIRIPETVSLPYSSRVIGDSANKVVNIGNVGVSGSSKDRTGNKGSYSGSNNIASVTGSSLIDAGLNRTPSYPVDSVTYRAVMTQLKTSSAIDPGLLNSVNSSPSSGRGQNNDSLNQSMSSQWVYSPLLPWGKIQMYSSLLQKVIDFPAYPEEINTERSATYTTMPDVIYQYEPWIVYQSSGPREQALSFHLHRDMWSGNHLDGKANELIQFCRANTFPRYSGSAVLSPKVRFYIDGSLFISGVLLNTSVKWSGPLGQDNWYLDFELSLNIQEVSEMPLNIDTVSKFGLIGG